MNWPVLIIRPEPGAERSLTAARALGLEACAFPLFAILPRAWDAPAPESFDALLLGSGNALRHGGAALASYIGKPAYCVGEATTRVAWSRGLIVQATGEGGLQDVLGQIDPEHTRLLRLAGAERVALALPAGISMEERVVYAAMPIPMPMELARIITASAIPACIVLLHSAEAARHMAAETDRLGISRARLIAITIGPRVSAACAESGGWAAILTAPEAQDAAMLALAKQTCQTGHSSSVGRSA